uniref:Uncharacterized protein n=1 Tax=Corethron hystrix TaxID=216773 RepID=A0A7S1FLX0_9STRA|mmetsp:Transcript_12652/g.27953  ORF Transcript_12652/g.27953 Transcript_12652/m.27953 type:complete len:282 (+) Transcript_12652:48-893(+)
MSLLRHHVVHILNVMYDRQGSEQRLLRLEQMPQVQPIVVLARDSVALRIDGHLVLFGMFVAFDVHLPRPHEKGLVPGDGRGIAGIEGINAQGHGADDGLQVGDAEEVAEFIVSVSFVEQGHHPGEKLVQLLFSIFQTAPDSISVEGEARQIFHADSSQLAIDAAVYNVVHCLLAHVFQVLPQTSGLPPIDSSERRFPPGEQLVQGYDDIDAVGLLRLHRALQREKNLPPVVIGPKHHSVLVPDHVRRTIFFFGCPLSPHPLPPRSAILLLPRSALQPPLRR